MPNKTHKPALERQVHTLDATDKILGRLATEAANLLRGKHKVSFERHEDGGDYVVITNAQAIKVTGNKLEDKKYYSHSGYIGNLKEVQLKTLMEKSPSLVIEKAVYGMLPKNRLRNKWMKRLTVHAGQK